MHSMRVPTLCLLALMMLGCAHAPWRDFSTGFDGTHLWPAPPAAPRLTFVGEVRSHADLFSEGRGLARLGAWLVGESDSALVRPYAVACHPAGGLLVSDPGARCVHYFDAPRHRYRRLGSERPEGLPSPVGLATLPDGRILVADSKLGAVLAYDASGEAQGEFIEADLMQRPAGIASRPGSGEVLIADVTAHRLGVFDDRGRHLRWIGSRGDAPGQFNFPTHLATGPEGRIAVTDAMNFRIQVLDANNQPLAEMGEPGAAPGRFAKPKGVAFDPAGNLMAIEGLHDALQFFDDSGRLLLSVGGPGSDPGRFWLPAGMSCDAATGLIYVADSYNSRVQVFRMLRPDEVQP